MVSSADKMLLVLKTQSSQKRALSVARCGKRVSRTVIPPSGASIG